MQSRTKQEQVCLHAGQVHAGDLGWVDPQPASDGRLWCVYRLRKHGEKRPKAEVRQDRQIGRLTVWGNVFDRRPRRELFAALDGIEGTGSLPMLAQVRLVQIDRGGVLLAGYERVQVGEGRRAQEQQFRQTWWCVPLRT